MGDVHVLKRELTAKVEQLTQSIPSVLADVDLHVKRLTEDFIIATQMIPQTAFWLASHQSLIILAPP